MFVTRLISGIVLVAVALVTILAGGPVLLVTLLAVSVIGMHELYQVTKVDDQSYTSSLAIAGYCAAIVYYTVLFLGKTAWLPHFLLLGLLAMMTVYVVAYPRYQSHQVMAAFFTLVYVAVMLSYIYQTRMLEHGKYTVWLIFFCSWGCDTCAYCVGMLFGRHKMAPVLSPKKSVEGAVGGVAGAVILGVVYASLTGKASWNAPLLEYGIICGIGAVLSMVGDLGASAIKRNHGIKDYGKLIPGHGGILDRFDSVIFVSPVIYMLSLILFH
ncbi:MAG: phosphatidate cytidylyltransferase [Lachnospiraceae bacterium]|nr:phosphatidate cytidylyltransferase [Lachnospiraceae bacterium]